MCALLFNYFQSIFSTLNYFWNHGLSQCRQMNIHEHDNSVFFERIKRYAEPVISQTAQKKKHRNRLFVRNWLKYSFPYRKNGPPLPIDRTNKVRIIRTNEIKMHYTHNMDLYSCLHRYGNICHILGQARTCECAPRIGEAHI